ncbi:MAG TPA: hypothetical protein VIU15_23955 [Streptomyces sp.]
MDSTSASSAATSWRTREDWWTSSRPLDVRYIDGTHLEDPALRCSRSSTTPAAN